MRVWAVMYDESMKVMGLLDVVADADLNAKLREHGAALLERKGVEGKFAKVERPEPYYQDNDRVYRCRYLTLYARPFKIEVPDAVCV